MESAKSKAWEQLSQHHGGGANEKNSSFQRYLKMNSGDQNNNVRAKDVYKVSPYGWQPPRSSKHPESASIEILTSPNELPGVVDPEISSFVYVDPDNEQIDKTEPVVPIRLGAEARKVCGQISKLLRNKESPSRGSRMFQKRRKRAAKFTTIAYGTQPPPEDDRFREVPDDETSSEELSRLDYSSEDDQIPAYDLPSVNNVLQESELKPSEKIIKSQFKHLAMDVGSMRGKGAKIFAKRQERMENYVITDENRRQQRPPSLSQENVIPQIPREASRGPYVRPGSSIAITPKSQFKKQGSLPDAPSGYCTDFEDDYKSPYQPQVNYFSDCEFSVPDTRGRSRKTRPVFRQSWGNEDPTLQGGRQEHRVPPPADSRPPMAPFRRVMPPGKSPYQSPAGRASRDSSLSRASLSPARDTNQSFEEISEPKRAWSRVTFNPRKPTPQQKTTQAAIDYPCARGYTSPARPAMNGTLVSRAPFQSPQRTEKTSKPPVPSFYQQKTQPEPAQALPASSKTNQNSQSSTAYVPMKKLPSTSVSKSLPPEKPTTNSGGFPSSAVSLLEKPMERKEKEAPQQFHQMQPSSEVPDFVGVEDFITQSSMEADVFVTNDSEKQTEKLNEEDQERQGSPASVASYVSSNSSTFTSILPSRCLTPPNRPCTPTGNHRVIKIASSGANGTPPPSSLAQQRNAPYSLNPQKNSVRSDQGIAAMNNCGPPAPFAPPVCPSAPPKPKVSQPAPSSAKAPSENKISACLKVLDPTKTLFQPKKPTEFKPSPTLSALLQSENEKSYGAMQTPPISYDYTSQRVPDPVYPTPVELKPVPKQPGSYQAMPTRNNRSQSSSRAPQPLGVIAEGMKGKGAKMFEKQLKRMDRYTKETTHDDFPELQSPRESNGSPVTGGRFSFAPPNRMAGFSPTGEKLEPGTEVKSGMRDVVGEFQKNSKKRPSETKKRGRDPLYYQQQLFYLPPSSADFVEPPPEPAHVHSEASSMTSSKPSSLSSFNTDTNKSDCQTKQAQEGDFVTSPTASGTSLGLDKRASASSSSISSQKSTGPRTAPKPSRELIQRQLSKPNSPVSTSPTPEVQNFVPASGSSSEISFQGVDKENISKCIEDLIERMPDDHRTDGNSNEDFTADSRRRTVSIDSSSAADDSDVKPGGNGRPYSFGLQPPSYNDVMSSSMPSMASTLDIERGMNTFGSEGDVRKSGGISAPKLKFNVRKNGAQAQSWKPAQ